MKDLVRGVAGMFDRCVGRLCEVLEAERIGELGIGKMLDESWCVPRAGRDREGSSDTDSSSSSESTLVSHVSSMEDSEDEL
mmetsp:Transcript_35833/g.83510  ORF Transcript_35833/g.83510 Transcript_35833/m.83510 type:complete len:81 (-) Transcript_35833:128-370(-)